MFVTYYGSKITFLTMELSELETHYKGKIPSSNIRDGYKFVHSVKAVMSLMCYVQAVYIAHCLRSSSPQDGEE